LYNLYLELGFVIFWQNNIGAKAAFKMLVKLTTELPSSGSPPPLLLPPDLSLGSKPFNLRTGTASKRESNNKESSESPKSYFGRRQSDETAKVKKGNDWY